MVFGAPVEMANRSGSFKLMLISASGLLTDPDAAPHSPHALDAGVAPLLSSSGMGAFWSDAVVVAMMRPCDHRE